MRDIDLTVNIEAPIATVWQFITDSEKIAMWLMENNFQARKGAHFRMECKQADGADAEIQAEVLEIKEPRLLVYSWLIQKPRLLTKVRIELNESKNHTALRLIHSGWQPLGNDPDGVRDLHESVWQQLLSIKLPSLM